MVNNKKISIILFIIFVFVSGIYLFNNSKKEKVATSGLVGTEENKKEDTKRSLCYLYSKKTDRNFFDEAWLKMEINGEKVVGEFRNLPAEKDSKVGTFEGTVGKLEQEKMARTADVWWNSLAEGMNEKEELLINFGDGSAKVFFGEMVDRGDGVYVYKDKNSLKYGPELSQISCEDLQEKLSVEKYVRDNIKSIATNKPVLGGSWNVISVTAIPSINTGSVIYEDGHIESTADFGYEFNPENNSVLIKNFTVKK
ncbi:MAG TPA: hypothetical protein PLO44_02600 [Candidatus Paceibacterota bacterium]|nr:hypothetical protein [Candidatus Paceibacterota bacterium]